jgi:sensor histidine kinase YesM
VIVLIISEGVFIGFIFVSLIGGISSLIIFIFLCSFEHRIEMVEMERDNIMLKASLKDAKFLHLSSQMKPHLLFNVLNSIISLLHFKHIGKASDAMYSLSHMLRYTIDTGQISKLQEECNYIHYYLNIERIRFEDRLHFEIDISPELLKMTVPSFCLQTLVENVCKHCMMKDERPIFISVIGKLEKDFVRLYVQDNGAGMSTDQINAFNQWKLMGINDDDTEHSPTGSIGLKNVYKRMKYHFGQGFTMEIENTNGTAVTLLIPNGRIFTDGQAL